MRVSRSLVFAFLTCLLVPASRSPAANAPASAAAFESRLAVARKLAAENSFALSLPAYAEALAQAPSPSLRRQCQLEMLAVEIALAPPQRIPKKINETLAELLSPYTKAELPRDAFWAAASELSASMAARRGDRAAALTQRLEMATHFGNQPPSPGTTPLFVSAIRTLGHQLATERFYSTRPASAVNASIALLRQATGAASADHRGEFALLLARALALQQHRDDLAAVEITRAYEAAVIASQNTPFAAAALIHEALWIADLPLPPGVIAKTTGQIFNQRFAKIDAALTAAEQSAATDPELSSMLKELRARRTELAKPTLSIGVESAYLPGTRISFDLRARHIGSVRLDLYRLDLALLTAVTEATKTAEIVRLTERLAPLGSWSQSTGIDSPFGFARTQQVLRESLPPGVYALLARDASGELISDQARWFLVTHARVVSHLTTDGTLTLHAFNQLDGQPLAPLQGTVSSNSDQLPFHSTSPDGARLTLREPGTNQRSIKIIGAAAGQPFMLSTSAYGRDSNHTNWFFHLQSDRPLYLPGETAHWKLIARTRADGQLGVPAGTRLKIAAKTDDREDKELGSWELPLNPLGSVSGDLALPASLAPTRIDFHVEVLDSSREKISKEIGAFRVDVFRAPEAKLELTAADPAQLRRAQPGDDIELLVDARYFSGEPIPAAPLSLTAGFRSHWQLVHQLELSDSQPDRSVWAPATVTATTDTRGQARMRIPLPPGLPPEFSINAMVGLNIGGTTAQAKFDYAILPAGYTATFSPGEVGAPVRDIYSGPPVPSLYAAPNQSIAVALTTRDGAGALAAANGEITLKRLTWEEVWRAPDGQLLTGAALRTRRAESLVWPPRVSPLSREWEKLHAAYRIESVSTEPLVTAASGRVVFNTPALPPVIYKSSITRFPVRPTTKIKDSRGSNFTSPIPPPNGSTSSPPANRG